MTRALAWHRTSGRAHRVTVTDDVEIAYGSPEWEYWALSNAPPSREGAAQAPDFCGAATGAPDVGAQARGWLLGSALAL